MSVAAYQYLSDNGNIYQVVLPTDFAAALGYVFASGLEPYLPSFISPRYATYVVPSNGSGAQVAVTRPFVGTSVPSSISIGGTLYLLQSSYGEVRGTVTVPNIVTIAGSSGPAGPAGATGATGAAGAPGTNADIITLAFSLTSAQLKAIHTTPITLVANPGSGKAIALVNHISHYVYGGTPYTGNNNLNYALNTLVFPCVTSSQMTGSADAFLYGAPGASSNSIDPRNQALTLTASADYAAGNGTVAGSLDYRIVTL